MSADVIDFPKLTRPPALRFEQLTHRLGRFVIAHEAITSNPEIVITIMAKVIVLQAACCNAQRPPPRTRAGAGGSAVANLALRRTGR